MHIHLISQFLMLCLAGQGLEVIESTNLKFFNKDMTAEFYALKGMFLSQLSTSSFVQY